LYYDILIVNYIIHTVNVFIFIIIRISSTVNWQSKFNPRKESDIFLWSECHAWTGSKEWDAFIEEKYWNPLL